MKKSDNSVFYESSRKVREEQEVKDLSYKIVLLKDDLEKTIKAKMNAKYKKDNDVIESSISNYKNQISEFEKRIQELAA